MLNKTIKELKLSPQAYMLLMNNGIKTIAALTTFTEDELMSLQLSYEKYNSNTSTRKIVEEIKDKLALYNLTLGMEKTNLPLRTEIKIKDVDFSNRIKYRLKLNGIITLGGLSLLDKKSILKINTFGEGAYEEIKKVISTIDWFTLGIPREIMVIDQLNDEDRDYYHKQRSILLEENAEYKKNKKEENELRVKQKKAKEKLFEIPISKLGIPQPIFLNEKVNNNKLTLGSLLVNIISNRIANASEVEIALRRLNIPEIHVGMSYKELEDITIGPNKLMEIEELIKNISLINEEESLLHSKILEEDNIRRERFLIEETMVHNEFLQEQIKTKELMLKQLENLLKEKERLEEINNTLSSKINEVSEKLGISIDIDNKGQGQNGK